MPATTEDHSLQTTVHRSHRWEYADEAARLAAGGFIATDEGKLALQLDNYSFWVLSDYAAPAWEQLGLRPVRRTVAADDDAEATDDIVFLNTAGGVVTLGISALTASRARTLTVKNIGGAGNSGFVDPGAHTIEGDAADYELVDGDKITLIPRTATAWEII